MQHLLEGGADLRPGAYHRKYGKDKSTIQKFLIYGFTIHLHSDLTFEKCKDIKFHLVEEGNSESFFN